MPNVGERQARKLAKKGVYLESATEKKKELEIAKKKELMWLAEKNCLFGCQVESIRVSRCRLIAPLFSTYSDNWSVFANSEAERQQILFRWHLFSANSTWLRSAPSISSLIRAEVPTDAN